MIQPFSRSPFHLVNSCVCAVATACIMRRTSDHIYNTPEMSSKLFNLRIEPIQITVDFVCSVDFSYEKNTRITFSKGFRHSGHLVTDEAHFVHATTWPHGKNAVLYSLE